MKTSSTELTHDITNQTAFRYVRLSAAQTGKVWHLEPNQAMGCFSLRQFVCSAPTVAIIKAGV